MKQLLTAIFLLLPVFCLAQKQDYDNWIYEGDKSITEYTIPDGVRKIAPYAFDGCENLRKVTIPSSVTDIEGLLFRRCNSMESIIVDLNNKFFVVENDVLYDKEKTKIVCCPPVKASDNYKIPENVSIIGFGAFFGCNNLTKLVISDHITEIHESAFEACERLVSVYIPANVKIIGQCAFGNCYQLQEFVVDKGNNYFSTIDGVLFNHDKTKLVSAPNLERYSVPNSTKIIGEFAFQGCDKLASITIPESVETIEKYALSICNSLTSVTIPGSIKTIGEYAFWRCENLTTVELSDGVEQIGERAFSNCTSLESIVIPKSVVTIGDAAFLLGTNLRSISIPKNVKKMGEYLCQKCYNLENISLENDYISKYAFSKCNSLSSVIIPSNIIAIEANAFWNCKNLKSVTIENGVEEIGEGAFRSCPFESITIPGSVKIIGKEAFLDCKNLKSVVIENGVEEIGDGAFRYCPFESITIPGSVKIIGKEAFHNNLKSVVIENGVEEIDESAFSFCTSLESITIPGSVKNISKGAFYGCENLKSVSIENGVEEIDKFAFSSCTSLESISIPGSVKNISKWAFAECKNLKSVSFENGVEEINTKAFSSLESIKIPGSVKSIGDSTFYNCSNLKSVVIENGVEEINTKAFSSCSSLESIKIPGSVKSIGDSTFYNCSNLKSVSFENGVEEIGISAFASCENLESINIPKSVKKICSYAFAFCSKLKSVIIFDGVQKIDFEVFTGCLNLKFISLPTDIEINDYYLIYCLMLQDSSYSNEKYCLIDDILYNKDTTELLYGSKYYRNFSIPNSVRRISDYAFAHCAFIDTLAIPGNVKEIGDHAFYDCFNLLYLTIEDGVGIIGQSAFLDCENLVFVSIAKSVKVIGDNSFRDCSNLSTIIIGDGVESIGDYAFSVCSNISSFTIPNTVKHLGNHSFSSCNNLVTITIGDGVESIGDYAFSDCSNISSFTIPNTVKHLGNHSFSGCNNLVTITIGDGVKSIGDYAFHRCIGLKSVKLPKNVKIIGNDAFMGCRKLGSIKLGNNVERIGICAFQDCNNLKSIIVPSSMNYCGEYAFGNHTLVKFECDTSFESNLLLIKIEMDRCKQFQQFNKWQTATLKMIDILNQSQLHEFYQFGAYSAIADYYCSLGDFDLMKQHSQQGFAKIIGFYEDCRRNGSLDSVQIRDFIHYSSLLMLKSADAYISMKQYDKAAVILEHFAYYKFLAKYGIIDNNIQTDRFDYHRQHDRYIYAYYTYLLMKSYYQEYFSNITNNHNCSRQYFIDSHGYDFNASIVNDLDDDYISFFTIPADDFRARIHNEIFDYSFGIDYESFDNMLNATKDLTPMLSSRLQTFGSFFLSREGFLDAFEYFKKSFNYEFDRLKENFSFMNAFQRRTYWQEHKQSFENLLKVAAYMETDEEAACMAYNSLLISKGLLLASEQSLGSTVQKSKNQKMIDDYKNLQNLKIQMDTASTQQSKDRIRDIAERLENDLMNRSAKIADVTDYMNVDWKKVQKSLGKHDVAIEFFIIDDYNENRYWMDSAVYALILKKDFHAPIIVEVFKYSWSSIWESLLEFMSPKGKVYFSPAGIINNIPIEYEHMYCFPDGGIELAPYDMIDSEDNECEKCTISDKYKIYRISSTRNLALSRNTSKSKSALIYGNILYNANLDTIIQNDSQYRGFDRGWNHLDDKGEIDSINLHLSSNGYKTTIMTQYEATEKSFKALSNNNYSIIHLSTHGVYENSIDDPMQSSALIFAGANDLDIRPDTIDDGILSAQEISYLNLKNTDLVVLSACVSGLGEITSEGVFGLQRGFKKAGANTIVMSLRNVNNFYTKQFMLLFYHNLSKGIQKHDAFVEAQREFRHLYPDPKIQNEALFIMLDGEK